MALWALQWLPVLLVLIMFVVVITDPMLLLSMAWEALQFVPALIRARLAQRPPVQAAAPSSMVLDPHHWRFMSSNVTVPPPAFAHPADLGPTQSGALWPAMLGAVAAWNGGAGCVWLLLTRGPSSVGSP